MELRQLKYFIKAAEQLSFTEAAVSCFITQGTLSQQIKQLETELDTLLFDRVGKRIYLTDAGRLFLPYARQCVLDSEGGRQILDDLKLLKTGELKLGVTHSMSSRLTTALITFSEKYPDVRVITEFGTSRELLEKLEVAGLDFVVSFVSKGSADKITFYPLFESRLALIVSKQHPLASAHHFSMPQLAGVPLVLASKGFSTRIFLDKLFEKGRYQPDIKMEMNDINTLLELVKTGRWCTILSLSAVVGHDSLTAIPFKEKGMVMQASISWLKDVYRKKSALVFMDHLLGI